MTDSRISANRSTRTALLAGAVAALLLVLHFYHPEQRGLWARTFFDALHVPVFGLIAVSIYAALPARRFVRRVVIAFALTASLGVLSELAQIATVRDASFRDFVADLFGAAGFLAAAVAVSRPASAARAGRIAAGLVAVVLLAIPLLPLARVSVAYLERNAQVPILVDPDAQFAATFFRRQNARLEFVRDAAGNRVMARVSFGEGPWPGVAFHDLWPDWRDYDALVLALSSATGEAFEINVRVHDALHAQRGNAHSDRYNAAILIPPEETEIRIPLEDIANAPRDREMNLAAIEEIIIYGSAKDAGRSFHVHEIRLR